ncbi:MAG: response regulator [Candidatus Riflebacteria bacterium]|nr:response regulator [Candidatus Riflebacteria bacterium]
MKDKELAMAMDNITGSILLVDDNPDNLKLLAKILIANGFTVRASDNGRYAFKSVSIDPPDLILLDVKMPDMDGYEFCRLLKADPLSVHIPVIFISGIRDEESKVKGFEVGGVDYITKPFQSREILARVQTHLSMSRMQRHLEEIVMERTSKLQAAREHFQKLFELASDAFFIHDLEGNVVDVNRQACRSLNFTHKEILQLKLSDFETGISPEQLKNIADRAANGVRIVAEGRHRRKDGSTFPVEVSLGVFQDQEPRLILAIARDISERKKAEAEREELQLQLAQAQKMESVGRLAGGVAHDFNNMLCVILGRAEMALTHLNQTHLIHADLEEICKAARHSADLTRQLLAFARKQAVAPKVLALNETVASDLLMLRPLLGENIVLEWKPGSNLWNIKLDPSQLSQILTNLCINSRDAISGVGNLVIETGNKTLDEKFCADHPDSVPGDYVMLIVSDDGCGMSEETLAHIFEPFFTTKDINKGTGLGLAMVYGAVRQNNGFIEVVSKPGRGTWFTVFLPRYEGPLEQAPSKKDPRPVQKEEEVVLLVEDDEALRETTRLMLEREKYIVLEAATPEKALTLFRMHSGKIRLLITDVLMPGLSGRDLAIQLRSLFPGLRCLFISGYTSDIIARDGILEKGVVFLQKPFDRKALSASVRSALSDHLR